MRFPWYVWRYQYRWMLIAGLNGYAPAKQLLDALNHEYADDITSFRLLRGNWALSPIFEIVGFYLGRRYSWGYTQDILAADFMLKSLGNWLNPRVALFVRKVDSDALTAARDW